MQRYENIFVQLVAEVLAVSQGEISTLLKYPEPDRGDFSLPCFLFAKKLKKNPAQIAAETVAAIDVPPMFSSIVAVGPYINATVDGVHIIGVLVPEITALGDDFATSTAGKDKTVLVESSSPNIAKPLGFHHLRSTMIGNALARIHDALGYNVVRLNFLGDWGKTFGLLAEAFKRFGDREELKKDGIAYLLKLYIQANKEIENNPSFDDAARAVFRSQEDGDSEAMEIWELFRRISLNEFQKIYDRLGVEFDHVEGESFYRDGMDAVVDKVSKTVGVREDQGALVVNMEYGENEPPMMLKKSDGATLYATRDMAAAMDRWERFGFEKSLYVVGNEQKLHFEQLRRALKSMGNDWSDRMTHVPFGRIHGMSTRKGKVVFLSDVLDEARDRAREKMSEETGDRDIDLDIVSEQVGVGGVVFGDLKNMRTTDYSFNWEEILNTKGFTGICCQYAHARCCSILRKAGEGAIGDNVDLSLLTAPEEAALIKDLAKIPAAVQSAAKDLEPARLSRAVYDAARSWNRYQQAGNVDRALRILCEDEKTRAARLALVNAVRIAVKKALFLLGVATPEAM